MARPWKMKPWPYIRKDSNKSWRIGYRDHEGRVRSRAFNKAKLATDWMDEYVTAERKGKDSLMRFILDLDAKEANAAYSGRRTGEIILMYLAHNRPEDEAGLAPSTYNHYKQAADRHLLGHEGWDNKGHKLPPWPHAQKLANTPIEAFNSPEPARAFNEELIRAGVSKSMRDKAWVVLSAALSWAAGSDLVPELQTNGCLLANEARSIQRRSVRRGGQGVPAATQRASRGGEGSESRALTSFAVEHIRSKMLGRVIDRDPILAHRDSMITSLQFGLGCRNQEVYGIRWRNVGKTILELEQVISWGVADSGKTYHSTPRSIMIPRPLAEDLVVWRSALELAGFPTRPTDYVIPGDLGGRIYGVREPATGACHFSRNQAKKWGEKFFAPAVEEVAKSVPALAFIGDATPYSLRRGGLTARLATDDPQVVAYEAGTSLQMLDKHYSHAIRSRGLAEQRPLAIAWEEAREEVFGELSRPRLRVVSP